jgi:predicted SAM-dependent methyltransferase
MTRIDLAGGLETKPGFLNVDRYAVGEGIQADCLYLPFADCSIEAVNTSHYLEHLSKYQVVPQLKEVYRVLQWGGAFHIEVPSLEWCCQNWLRWKSNDWNMDAIYGDQSSNGQYHKTGFTRQIMYGYLGLAGFRGAVVSGETWSHEQQCLLFDICKE